MKSLRINLTINPSSSGVLLKHITDMPPRARGEYLRKVASIGHHVLTQSGSLTVSHTPLEHTDETVDEDSDVLLNNHFTQLINTKY